ncbi:MAG: [FeFe] hydrogenase H-cluster maturation GTPase HydF [Bacteroidales bacterium]|nr:[FeFe] hydrogenase H-cluster maturation GTPase HydF [Bacteroidales bacterium]
MKGRENKPHIGIFGRRNYGKSSLINALTNQDIAIVSDSPGTTTDPVKKSMEIAGIGPVVLIDTAGIDDFGELGELRTKKTRQIIGIIDLAILILTENRFGIYESELLMEFYEKGVPVVFVHNKSDLESMSDDLKEEIEIRYNSRIIDFNALQPSNLEELIEVIRISIPETAYRQTSLLGDLISSGDIVLLITPIDIEAPEGRMILPQVQVIRDILDNNCIAIILKENEAAEFLKNSGIRPKLVITDSSVFQKVDDSIPGDIPLTGFSILLAKHKGEFQKYLEGTPRITELQNGDSILILESCTHQVSCEDIGRIKIPRWISNFTGKKLDFDVVAGLNKISKPITRYALVIQCGGCMITRKQLVNRLRPAIEAGVPVTNYGMAIAYVQGIYERAIAPFVKQQQDK